VFVRVSDIPHEGVELAVEELIPPLDPAFGEVVPVVGPAFGTLNLQPLAKGVVRVQGRVACSLLLCCSRCLDTFLRQTEVGISEPCVPLLKGSVLKDDLKDAFSYIQGVIDLTALYRTFLYSSLQMKPLCSEDCKGLCPVCGVNRNRESCDCEKPARDTRWNVLDEIKERLLGKEVA